MPLHDSYYQFAKDTQVLVEANQVALGLTDVFFGDQTKIPRTPAVCIEPGGKTRELNGIPRRTYVTLTVYLILYHYRIDGIESIREDNDFLTEQLEAVLHVDAQMKAGGEATVIDSMVRDIESGFQQKANSLFRASRLTFEAHSQMQLPFSTP